MSGTRLLIDSSALLAKLLNEPGGDAVWQIMEMTPEGDLFMHAVNACEVAYQLIKNGCMDFAAYSFATPRDVNVINSVTPGVWQRAASLKAKHRSLALGDCIAVAQAELLNADILTGDRAFQQVDTRIGIKLFR